MAVTVDKNTVQTFYVISAVAAVGWNMEIKLLLICKFFSHHHDMQPKHHK